jgi:hypothetical protein
MWVGEGCEGCAGRWKKRETTKLPIIPHLGLMLQHEVRKWDEEGGETETRVKRGDGSIHDDIKKAQIKKDLEAEASIKRRLVAWEIFG